MVVVKLKLDLSDGMSNNSDFSNDSQNSQMSTADFMASMNNGVSSQTSSVSNIHRNTLFVYNEVYINVRFYIFLVVHFVNCDIYSILSNVSTC